MTIWDFYLIVAFILVSGSAFIWLILTLKNPGYKGAGIGAIDQATLKSIESFFTPEFKEELKNRGRLHFEQIIKDNAESLEQNLKMTSTELGELLKKELNLKVDEALTNYQQAVSDAKQQAVESIKKTSQALDEQHQALSKKIQEEIAAEKDYMIDGLNKQVTEIVRKYIVSAVSSQIDLSSQLEFILKNFEENKEAMVEDIKNVG